RGSLAEDTRPGARSLLQKYEKKVRALEKESARAEKLWAYEREAARAGAKRPAGLDEAGRGPLVGAVVAAAVVLPEGWACAGLNESKKLTPEKRDKLFETITREALAFGVGEASAAEIDALNIYRATQAAMGRAVAALLAPPDFLLTDAMPLPEIRLPQKPIVQGDALSASIAAASIVAKVTRDRQMAELDKRYPGYGFASHKGYGTEEHLKALDELGPCPEHRVSFGPVAKAVVGRSTAGPAAYWQGRLEAAKNGEELRQVGHQIKRLGAADLKPAELGFLREAYRKKSASWGGE
ncbi:MAG TPA: ribonuclease HII, partial [bacterium]|nr:ribonuclease HII [bacterium]